MVDNRDSILNTIKPMLNVEVDDKNFDVVLIPFINSALSIITQLGIGPSSGFKIKDETEVWAGLFEDREDLDIVITDIYLRVRLWFDPPQNSFLVTAIKEQIVENDWRVEALHNPVVTVTQTLDSEV